MTRTRPLPSPLSPLPSPPPLPPSPPPSLTLGGCPAGRPWRSERSVEYFPARQPGLGALQIRAKWRIRGECDDDERRGRRPVVQRPPGRVNSRVPCRSTVCGARAVRRSFPHLYSKRWTAGKREEGRGEVRTDVGIGLSSGLGQRRGTRRGKKLVAEKGQAGWRCGH